PVDRAVLSSSRMAVSAQCRIESSRSVAGLTCRLAFAQKQKMQKVPIPTSHSSLFITFYTRQAPAR
ncbi:MAG TPA: hypothetical protein VN893_06210, partial [Bryobacteraceae bacterium]|nr:hypothetical protein [Bryobacteraceae bacterium]